MTPLTLSDALEAVIAYTDAARNVEQVRGTVAAGLRDEASQKRGAGDRELADKLDIQARAAITDPIGYHYGRGADHAVTRPPQLPAAIGWVPLNSVQSNLRVAEEWMSAALEHEDIPTHAPGRD